jgi:two-component system chemotaxis response regulator CheB
MTTSPGNISSSPIRVFLVEDSPVAMAILQRILSSSPDIEVIGTARNGLEALEKIPQANPQVICTDLHMPKMSGLDLTRRLMAEFPRPILVISASVQEDDSSNVFQLLQAGAVDVFPKPPTGLPSEYEQAREALISRVKVLAGVAVFTQRYRPEPDRAVVLPKSMIGQDIASTGRIDIRSPKVVAIGASTGGPQSIHTILRQLPPTFPIPILCVQHISEGFLQGLVDWLSHESPLKVVVAESGMIPMPGMVYFPPERKHLLVDSQGRLALSTSAPVCGHCPSVTVLFESVATYYRRSAIGVLLTGMGRDGADGMKAIAQQGGFTIAQDEATSIVFGMPKEAIALGAAQRVLPLPEIAPSLLERVLG